MADRQSHDRVITKRYEARIVSAERGTQARFSAEALEPHRSAPSVLVEIDDRETGERTLGRFQGDVQSPLVLTGLFSAPDPDFVLVVAAGQGYFVDTRRPAARFDAIDFLPITDVAESSGHGLVLIANF